MHKHTLVLLVFFALALTACQGNAATATEAPATTDTSPAENGEQSTVANCTVVSSAEASGESNSPFLPIGDDEWSRGPEDAKVTIIEYGDFQCPSCGALYTVLAELEAKYLDDLRVVFRHFPLIGTPDQVIHDKAALAAQAAEAAGLQGAFWEMHDVLFSKQTEWALFTEAEFTDWVIAEAEALGLDSAQFAEDLNSEALVALAQAAWDDNVAMGLYQTPSLVINGQYYSGPTDSGTLSAVIELILLEERQFQECPPMQIDALNDYTATIHTEKGDIVLELFPEVAPFAVNNFVFLAENDWYDGVTFHRVIPGFMAQAGDPTGTGFGGPGYAFEIEVSPDLLFDQAGLLAMANAGSSANGSQFFITYGPQEHLNGQYTIFGQVISGMDVLNNLTPRNPEEGFDLPPGDLILDISIQVQ